MKNLNAGKLSMLLIAVLGLLVIALIGGSVYAASTLIAQSKDATHAAIDADISAGETGRLEGLEIYLKNHADSIEQTRLLTKGIGSYDQNTIVATINGYASRSQVGISGFDFDTATATPGSTPAAAAAAANTGSATTVNITLSTPVRYSNLIIFLKLLEQGQMPAQITSGSISAQSDDPNLVSVDQLTIKVVK